MAGAVWRTLGTERSGETLLEAFAGSDEQNRMLAGMALVKAGERSLDLIQKKVEAGEAGPTVVRLLPDIASPRARDLLSQLAGSESAALAETARQCLEQVRRIDDIAAG